MQLKNNPKLVLVALVAIFLLAFALSLYFPGYTTTSTTPFQGGSVTLVSSGNAHVIYVHYYFNGTQSNVTGTNYVNHPCLNHN